MYFDLITGRLSYSNLLLDNTSRISHTADASFCRFLPGTHGDLLIIVFHKIITTGHQRLQPLFDCLLTILVNGTPLAAGDKVATED